MRLRGLYIHFEIEKISIFLCQKVMLICVLTRVVLTNARKPLLLLIDFRRFPLIIYIVVYCLRNKALYGKYYVKCIMWK